MTDPDGYEYDYTYNAYGDVTSETLVAPQGGPSASSTASPTPTDGLTYTASASPAPATSTSPDCEETTRSRRTRPARPPY